MCGAAWGGSEELWSRTALRLAAEGFAISVSLGLWSPPHPRVLQFRSAQYLLWLKGWRALTKTPRTPMELEVARLFAARPPELVVFSDGGPFPPIELMESCITKKTFCYDRTSQLGGLVA
jgi:hypothetical protein